MADQRAYGSRADEIHPFFRAKRPWSGVKDKILKDYITCYLRTIHGRGRPIFIVDARTMPAEIQAEARRRGLIPDLPPAEPPHEEGGA